MSYNLNILMIPKNELALQTLKDICTAVINNDEINIKIKSINAGKIFICNIFSNSGKVNDKKFEVIKKNFITK